MGKIVIGSELGEGSKVALSTGIHWGEKLSLEPIVLHGDPIEDYEAYNTIFGIHNIDLQHKDVDDILKANTKVLQKIVSRIPSNVKNIKVYSRSGSPEDVLIQAAEAEKARLIVLGLRSDKPNVATFTGKISEAVIHRSNKSVMVVKNDVSKLKRIMVAYDFSSYGQKAIEWGEKIAKNFRAQLDLVWVREKNSVESEKRSAELARIANELRSKGITVNESVVVADSLSVSGSLLNYQKEHSIELIVVGTHGRNKLAELFVGSVAIRVVRRSPCTVLVVK